jgi:hypothetical protein
MDRVPSEYVPAAVLPPEIVPAEEVREHRRSYLGFERMVAICALHIALALACLALAFIGHAPAIAVLLGVGGSLVTIAAFVIYGASHDT